MELLFTHIHKENNILFLIAENMLDDRSRALLQQDFEQAEAAAGAGVRERYERIAAQLEKDWAR
jgi:hemerythrin-like domain-containing protein